MANVALRQADKVSATVVTDNYLDLFLKQDRGVMFWALNGATRSPRRARARHRPAQSTDLPALDVVPWTMMAGVRRLGRKAGAPDGSSSAASAARIRSVSASGRTAMRT